MVTTQATPLSSSQLDAASLASAQALITSGQLKHVAMIMDGNRRWAKERGKTSPEGHLAGFQALKTLVRFCSDELKLPAMTVYAFSTENWKRPKPEVEFLLKLFDQALQQEIDELVEKNVRMRFLGDIGGFSPQLQKACQQAEAKTARNTGMLYHVALNYGGRAELVRTVQGLAQEVAQGRLTPEAITEDVIGQRLDTLNAPEPDLLIRTGGEYRLSNFLLWQAAYAELYIEDQMWPDFTPQRLLQAMTTFETRQRRFGK